MSYELMTSLVMASLVLIGWKVIYNNAKKIASRNETYSVSNQILSILSDIQKMSESFWIRDEFNENPQFYELLVLSKTKQISSKIKVLKGRNVDVYDINRLVFPIRKSCTLDIHLVTSKGVDGRREQLEQILNATLAFEQALDKQMQLTFPSNY
ncbi:hypothetical protein [Shewanella algae]|uniref:hypothetical protein n=1 Tax=Shewanella algae TaxID=38313 RepID=UPI001BF02159|nr:hypothetical protein [Shewanella algae]BCV49594.1 hypothetical protein TUM17382_22870 [Shewanella algae]